MNIQHLRYLVEVERAGSITKAAENLFMGQPNLSKAVREAENELGITVFSRGSKGIMLTEKGARVLEYARIILAQMDKIEALEKSETADTIHWSACSVEAPYISCAFEAFVKELDRSRRMNIGFRETSTPAAAKYIADGTNSIGIIRFPAERENYYISLAAEKNIGYERLLDFEYRVIISSDDPLSDKDIIEYGMLCRYTELTCADCDFPRISEGSFVCTGGWESRFRLTAAADRVFTLSPPVPEELLEKSGLIQKRCVQLSKKYSDIIIFPKENSNSEFSNMFKQQLYKIRDKIK